MKLQRLTYYVTDHVRRYPIVLVRLSRIDRDALRDLLSVSWWLTSAKARRSGGSRDRSKRAIDERTGRDD